MSIVTLAIIVLTLLHRLVLEGNCLDEVACTVEFCEKYYELQSCPQVPYECTVQNGTYNGIVLPFPGPCDCCNFCLANLKRDEDCSIGSPSSTLSTNICSDGLACDALINKCRRMETSCTRAQDEYDDRRQNGMLGYMETRPVCDGDGKYKPYKCVPNEICYCVDEEGNRIYGEMIYEPLIDLKMKCGCSRYYERAKVATGQRLDDPRHRFRCTPDGNFDALQCIGAACFCVDPITGEPLVTDKSDTVNVTLIDEDRVTCFDKRIHSANGYYHECDRLVIDKLTEMDDYVGRGYEPIGFAIPSCAIDGNYAIVQSNGTHKYCSQPDGEPMENYVVDVGTPLANEMNCACARARSLLASKEKPICQRNGNYEPVQCRRDKCRCVDVDGNQEGVEKDNADVDELNCRKQTSRR